MYQSIPWHLPSARSPQSFLPPLYIIVYSSNTSRTLPRKQNQAHLPAYPHRHDTTHPKISRSGLPALPRKSTSYPYSSEYSSAYSCNSVFHHSPDNPAKRLGQQNQSYIYYSPDLSPLSCTRVHLYLPLSVSAAAVPPRHAAPCHSQTPYQNRTTDPVPPRVPPVI